MRDHRFENEYGVLIPVEHMSMLDLVECLQNGIHVLDDEVPGDVMERLRIEIRARQLGISGIRAGI